LKIWAMLYKLMLKKIPKDLLKIGGKLIGFSTSVVGFNPILFKPDEFLDCNVQPKLNPGWISKFSFNAELSIFK
jgi:hypothetical protein